MLLKLIESLTPYAPSRTLDDQGRNRLLAGFLLLSSVLVLLMFVVRFTQDGWRPSTLIVLATSMILLALLVAFRLTGNRHRIADLAFIMALLAIATLAYNDHGLYSRTMTWLPALPLLANFIGGRIRTIASAVLVILLLLALQLCHLFGVIAVQVVDGNEWGRFIAFVASTIMVSYVAHIYEANKRIADAERLRLDTLRREWVAVVSHELRTPLTALRGSLALSLAPTEHSLPAATQTLLEIAQRNAERMVVLVNDLLDMERINAGKLQLNIAACDINALLHEVAQVHGPSANNKGIRLQVSQNEMPVLAADPARLIQVLQNLLSNAIKFSPANQLIELTAAMSRDMVRVEIVDYGPGIDPELAARLFMPFSQSESQDNRRHGGLGLGLSICKAIIAAHGGHIGFINRPQSGCSFYFEIPAATATTEAQESR